MQENVFLWVKKSPDINLKSINNRINEPIRTSINYFLMIKQKNNISLKERVIIPTHFS